MVFFNMINVSQLSALVNVSRKKISYRTTHCRLSYLPPLLRLGSNGQNRDIKKKIRAFHRETITKPLDQEILFLRYNGH